MSNYFKQAQEDGFMGHKGKLDERTKYYRDCRNHGNVWICIEKRKKAEGNWTLRGESPNNKRFNSAALGLAEELFSQRSKPPKFAIFRPTLLADTIECGYFSESEAYEIAKMLSEFFQTQVGLENPAN